MDYLPVKGMDATQRMLQRRQQLMSLVADGLTLRAACQQMRPPLSIKTYEKWRQRDHDFRRLIDSIRVGQNKPADDIDLDQHGFPVFRKRYFGHDSPPVHIEIAEALERPGQITLVLIPPFHGKTTNLADKMCEIIAKDANTRIGYVTESQSLAIKVCGRLRRRMTEERIAKKYMQDYGPFFVPGQEKRGKPWGEKYFTVYKADHDENDYTFEALGWSSQIYGARWDIGVLDDYQTLRNTRNPAITDKMLEIYQQDILTRVDLEAGGRIIIIGTRVAQRDFYSELINNDSCDTVIIRPAINYRGEALWQEKWDVEKLTKQRKRVGEKVWHRAYMMRPQDEGTATFTEAVLDECKQVRFRIGDPAETNEDCWAGLDPALDKWAAIVGAAITPDTFRINACRHEFEMGTAEGLMSMVYETWRKIRFSTLVVEAVSFQKALARDERLEKMKRECGFEIIEHTTASNKLDETFGVARMASSFIDHSVILPWADDDTKHAIQLFLDEALQWRATIATRLRTQDLIMAMWFMWIRWQRMRKDSIEETKAVKGEGLPYAPMSLPGGITPYAPLVRAGR